MANYGTLFLDLRSFQIYKNLTWLNDLPQSEAESVFLACCGSTVWARRMAGSRPFPVLDNLFETAERTWGLLSTADLLEAFTANEPTGTSKMVSLPKEPAAEGSSGTQSGAEMAEFTVRDQLVEAYSLYEGKFGFIFIVYTGEKTSAEILAICRARFGNSIETELKIATEEQRKIMETGLNKLLEK